MKEKLQFVRLPILLFVIFFVGRLALGAAMGVSKPTYDLGNRLFSMVILEVHVGLLWGAVGRRYRGYGIGGDDGCCSRRRCLPDSHFCGNRDFVHHRHGGFKRPAFSYVQGVCGYQKNPHECLLHGAHEKREDACKI